MSIPDKAVEAAKDAVARDLLARRAAIVDDQHIALILEAAAPFIAAQALRDHAVDLDSQGYAPFARWANRSANSLDPQ